MHSMPLQNILDKIRGEKTDGKWLHLKFILHRSHHKCEDKKRFITWCLQKSKYNLFIFKGGEVLAYFFVIRNIFIYLKHLKIN